MGATTKPRSRRLFFGVALASGVLFSLVLAFNFRGILIWHYKSGFAEDRDALIRALEAPKESERHVAALSYLDSEPGKQQLAFHIWRLIDSELRETFDETYDSKHALKIVIQWKGDLPQLDIVSAMGRLRSGRAPYISSRRPAMPARPVLKSRRSAGDRRHSRTCSETSLVYRWLPLIQYAAGRGSHWNGEYGLWFSSVPSGLEIRVYSETEGVPE